MSTRPATSLASASRCGKPCTDSDRLRGTPSRHCRRRYSTGTSRPRGAEIRDATGSFLFGSFEVFASGIGACCPAQGFDNACIRLYANAATFDLEAALAWYAETFADDPHCFGLKFELEGNTEPRCEPDDPDCRPLAVCEWHLSDEACCQAPAFDPEASRTPVYPDAVTDQPCTHDGDCVIGGQGGRCENWQAPPLPSPRSALAISTWPSRSAVASTTSASGTSRAEIVALARCTWADG